MLYKSKCSYSTTEATWNICSVFDEAAINECPVPWWFGKFCVGDVSLQNALRGKSEKEVYNDEVKELAESDPQQTMHEMEQKLGADHAT